MENNCGCNESAQTTNVTIAQEDQIAQCPARVHETVCVQAHVTITPSVVVGDVSSFCVGNPIIGACPGTLVRNCTFEVSQNICVEVPLTFSATATAVERGLVCGNPLTGTCPAPGCTFTRGFFLNHPLETNALITAAGGSIILGIDAQGFSFTVTTANAGIVLAGNTPLQPGLPPIYEQLYAQLLTADLNVLNGATCPFATAAIAAANTFLATSPPDQVTASELVAQLTSFNEGTAQGCPVHCPEETA